MENLKIAYYTFNLYRYEDILPPPTNLPEGVTTFYVTDNEDFEYRAKEQGWDRVINFTNFSGEKDPFKMRVAVSYIKIFFGEIVPELLDYDLVFISDSNIIRLFDGWFDFYNDSLSNINSFTLAAVSGYNKLEEDNFEFELLQSSCQSRWAYNAETMKIRVRWYINKLKEVGVQDSVISAKYMVWNPKHVDFEFIKELFYEESQIHLQGNLILGFMAAIHPDKVRNFYTENQQNGELTLHVGQNR